AKRAPHGARRDVRLVLELGVRGRRGSRLVLRLLLIGGLFVLGPARLTAELADTAAQRTTQVSHSRRSEEQGEDDQDDQELLPTQATDHDRVPSRRRRGSQTRRAAV